MTVRVGVDIGGTFTDIAIEDGDERWSVKVPTTHAAPEEGVFTGLARGLALANRKLSDVSLLVHGTTLATNALIERKGARTALLTTEGFRDVLEMGSEGRFDQYDLRVLRPEPIIPRSLRFGVRERLRHDGSVIAPLDLDAVRAAAGQMADAGVEAVAVAFLHAYANGDHERSARRVLNEALAGIPISVSHEVSPEMREYDRVSTTSANAYLQPVVSQYLLRLEERLKAEGLAGPMLMILSSGSLSTVETASKFPVRLLESGPAGGAIFACDIAQRLGLDSVLSFDVGGTTAKFCMIDGGQARQALTFEAGRTHRFKKGSGLPLRVPVVDLVEIGAGGGSIARIDSVGRIAVGPDSAGSEPGPACYGRGGVFATVTDCDLTLGKLDPFAFAGGSMILDAEAARTAIASDISEASGLTPQNAAYAVTETIVENMAAAARVHAAEVGADIEARTLIAFGGGAPLHAVRFAEKLGIREIVIPEGAGVGSAIGFLRAPLAYEMVRTARLVIPGGDLAPVRAALQEMAEQATALVQTVGVAREDLAVRRGAYMRYLGQGHDVEVEVEGDPADEDFPSQLHAAFNRAYRRLYGQAMDDNPVEVTAWTVRVHQRQEPARLAANQVTRHSAEPVATRQVYNGQAGAWQPWAEFNRAALQAGAQALGPSIVAEAETTTVIPAGFSLLIDDQRFIRISQDAPR